MRFATIFASIAIVLPGLVAAAPYPDGADYYAIAARDLQSLIARGGNGDSCQTDDDCDSGLICQMGYCAKRVYFKNGKGKSNGKSNGKGKN